MSVLWRKSPVYYNYRPTYLSSYELKCRPIVVRYWRYHDVSWY